MVRLLAFEHPDMGRYCRSRWPTEGRAWGDLDSGVVRHTFELPRGVPGTEVGAVPVHHNVDGGADRRAVAPVRGQQDGPLMDEGLEYEVLQDHFSDSHVTPSCPSGGTLASFSGLTRRRMALMLPSATSMVTTLCGLPSPR